MRVDNHETAASAGLAPPRWESTFPYLLVAGTGIMVLGWLLYMADRGLDFTDEGYYLNWIAYPFDYSFSVTQFGFVYHPLYRLFGGDIAWLRRANILLVYVLSCALSIVALRGCPTASCASVSAHRWRQSFLVAGAGSCGLVYFSIFGWLPTPSYNSLTLQALLMVAIGTLGLTRRDRCSQALAVTFLGLGGCLAFLAKPTSAILAATLVSCYAMARGVRSTVLSVVSAVIAVVLVGAFAAAVDGDTSRFLARLQQGLADASLLLQKSSSEGETNGLHTLLDGSASLCLTAIGVVVCASWAQRICGWTSALLRATPMFQAAIARLATKIAWLRFPFVDKTLLQTRSPPRQVAIVTSCLLVTCCLVMLTVLPVVFSPIATWNILCVVIGITAISLGVVRFSNQRFTRRFQGDLGDAGFLMALPCAYVFGSGNPYADVLPGAAVMWTCSAVMLGRWLVQTQHVMACRCLAVALFQLLTVTSLAYGMRMPYRQDTPLWLQMTPVNCNGTHSRIRLDSVTAGYLRNLRVRLQSQGFVPGDPILDCSGFTPGLIHALGGRPIGAPWLIGTCAGSLEFGKAMIERVPMERLLGAWILTDDNSPFTIDASKLLKQFSRDIDRDYDRVVSLVAPDGFRSLVSGSAPITQNFYRPRPAH